MQEAIRRLKAGEARETSSEYLVRSFRARLVSYFRNHSFSNEDAEDLVQEVFRRVFRGIEDLRDEARFIGWMFQIARNVRLTAQSNRSQAVMVGIQDVDLPSRDSERIQGKEKLDKVWRLIESLPEQQRQCLVLRVLHDMSYEEIASVLKLSPKTVRNHLREGRIRLRQEIGDV